MHALGWAFDRMRDCAIHGDEAAMSAYGSAIWDLTYELQCMVELHPKIVKNWSKSCSEIPALVGESSKDKLYFKTLYGLGEAGTPRMKRSKKGRGMSTSTKAHRIVSEVCCRMNNYRTLGKLFGGHTALEQAISKLPEYCTKNWSKWADAGWKWILEMTDNAPENHAALKEIGSSARRKSKADLDKTADSFAHHKIKEVLYNSFKAMAPP